LAIAATYNFAEILRASNSSLSRLRSLLFWRQVFLVVACLRLSVVRAIALHFHLYEQLRVVSDSGNLAAIFLEQFSLHLHAFSLRGEVVNSLHLGAKLRVANFVDCLRAAFVLITLAKNLFY